MRSTAIVFAMLCWFGSTPVAAEDSASEHTNVPVPLISTTGDSLRGLTAPVFEVRARRIERQEALGRCSARSWA